MRTHWFAVSVVVLLVPAACSDSDGGVADLARFCEVNAEIEQLDDLTSATPDQAREIAAQARELLTEAEEVSPQEISSATKVTADSYRQVLDFYEDADFDVDPADFEAAIAIGDLGVDPPEAQVTFDWLDDNCDP